MTHTQLPATVGIAGAVIEMLFDSPESATGTSLVPAVALNFPAYGRGVAASYVLRLRDASVANFLGVDKIIVGIHYDGLGRRGSPSLLSVQHPGAALVPGSTVMGWVVLTEPAPDGGLRVTLTSGDPQTLRVARAVNVAARASTAQFAIDVLRPTGPIPPTLTVTSPDGATRRARVHVPAPAAPAVDRRDLGDGAVLGIAQTDGQVFAGLSPPGTPPPTTSQVHSFGLSLQPGPTVPSRGAPPQPGRRPWPRPAVRRQRRRRLLDHGGRSDDAAAGRHRVRRLRRHRCRGRSRRRHGLRHQQEGIARGKVHVLTADNVTTVAAVTAPDNFNGVLGLAPDGAGQVYVARGFVRACRSSPACR